MTGDVKGVLGSFVGYSTLLSSLRLTSSLRCAQGGNYFEKLLIIKMIKENHLAGVGRLFFIFNFHGNAYGSFGDAAKIYNGI